MYSVSLLVLALAVFGASANCGLGNNLGLVGSTVGLNSLNLGNNLGLGNNMNLGNNLGLGNNMNLGNNLGLGNNMNLGSTLGASAPVFENPTIRLPGLVTPPTVQDTCNCVNTVVRPHVRKEVFTFPSVQRFVQTTSSPIVETVPYVSGGAADVPSTVSNLPANFVNSGLNNGFSTNLGNSGLVSSGLTSGVISGGLTSGLISGGLNSGFSNNFGTSGLVSSGLTSGVISGGLNNGFSNQGLLSGSVNGNTCF